MPGKKAHKSRIVPNAGMHGVHERAGQGHRSEAQTGEFGRDGKGRRGQFSSAGTPPLIKK